MQLHSERSLQAKLATQPANEMLTKCYINCGGGLAACPKEKHCSIKESLERRYNNCQSIQGDGGGGKELVSQPCKQMSRELNRGQQTLTVYTFDRH